MSWPSFLPDIPIKHIVWALELPLVALNGLALATLTVAWSGGSRPVVTAMASLVCLFTVGMGVRRWGSHGTVLVGRYVLARLTSLIAVFSFSLPDAAWPRVASVAAATGCLLAEPVARAFAAQAFPYAAGFPGVKTRTAHLPADTIFWVNLVAITTLVVAGDHGPLWQFAVTAVAAATNLALTADLAVFAIARLRFNARLPRLWDQMKPTFAVHWQAAGGSLHQLTMWIDYLKELGKPFFIITRTRENFLEAVANFDVPVLHRVGLDAVEEALSPSLKTVFYVNTAILNDHMLRYPHLNHIQLNHGDSDKIASYSPVFRAYDKDFVAGQAAVDRFAAAGLATAPDFFVIVGRPQVAAVEPSRGPIASLENPTVLYAPTWCGNTKDSDYTSVRRGLAIVRALLDRGCTVVFRPHPYWYKNFRTAAARDEVVALLAKNAAATGRKHVYGEAAESAWSIIDCFNQSDFMISDVSSVVNDYLYSEKPLIMMAVTTGPEEFAVEFPVARGAYVVDYWALPGPVPSGGVHVTPGRPAPGSSGPHIPGRTGPVQAVPAGVSVDPDGAGTGASDGPADDEPAATLEAALDAIWGDDPLASTRRDLKTYYLGDIPRDQYAQRFAQEAAQYV
ncbi:MAG: CDP-glycerol glycerophosphotransferase family protein [Bifidobacteriaceae bacterium]|jgi:hypothetical protein|nr:CDP-glycerol glycerophosphotransferase family protein [Bifidobacteriaceae bacterium]